LQLPELSLTALGFTEFESRLYFALLRQSPLSGYRLAQIVGKAPTNTYQALKSLRQKGALLVTENEGEATTYFPVPPDELIAVLTRVFESRRDYASRVLKDAHVSTPTEQVFQLHTGAQTLERAQSMLDTACEIVLFDLFPEVYARLNKNIEAARERGVKVVGITYDGAYASDYTLFNEETAPFISQMWPGLGAILIADGAQKLVAQLSRDMDSVLNGIWSDSPFLSCAHHGALSAEIRWVAMRQGGADRLKDISLMASRPPGFRRAQQQTHHGAM